MGLNHTRESIALSANRRFFYGWAMVAVGSVGIFTSGPAQSHTFSVFINHLTRDLNLSHGAVSTAYGAATLVAAFGLPYVGRAVDRYGARRVLLVVSILFGLATVAFGMVGNLLVLTVAFGALRFLGQGSLMLVNNNLVAQWFHRRRGFALSLTALGFSVSMAVHPSLAQWLIDETGWRGAWVWMGLITWLTLLPMVLLLVQDRPEKLGLAPDGDQDADSGGTQSAYAGLTLAKAMATSTFWIIAVGLATLSMLVTGIFFHQVSILTAQGLEPQVAARLFGVSAVVMVVSMPVFGALVDRLPTPLTFACALLLMAAALASLAWVHDLRSAMIFAVIFGMCNAGIHSHYVYVWPRYFGRKHLGSIQGAAQTIGVVGASLGPIPFGVAYSLYESYTAVLLICAAWPVVCAALMLKLREPKLEDEPAA